MIMENIFCVFARMSRRAGFYEGMAEHTIISRIYINGVPFEFDTIDRAQKTFTELKELVTKSASDRKARDYTFSTSSHPVGGRSVEVLVTSCTTIVLDTPLGW